MYYRSLLQNIASFIGLFCKFFLVHNVSMYYTQQATHMVVVAVALKISAVVITLLKDTLHFARADLRAMSFFFSSVSPPVYTI